MNKLNIKSRTKVEPSTRDSISTWLDVLTGMLVMPDPQRLQVRDELEDHLRSRVDDLLIMGKSEPEAIRIAVAELGETAELAKLITHAHTKSNPRRTIMNAALITIALAGMSFGGFTFINATGAPGATPSSGGAVPVVVINEARKDDEHVHTFELEGVSMKKMLSEITAAFDREVVFSVGSKKRGYLWGHMTSLSGAFTFDQAIERFLSAYDAGVMDYKLEITDELVIHQTPDEYQRKLIEMLIYPSPTWLHEDDRYAYSVSLTNLLKVKYDLKYTSIEFVDSALVVAAPPSIHVEVKKLMVELDSTVEQRRTKAIIEQKATDHELDIQRSKKVSRFRTTYNDTAHRLSVARERLVKQEARLQSVKVENDNLWLDTDYVDPAEIEVMDNRMRVAKSSFWGAQKEVQVLERRVEYLFEIWFDTEYAYLHDDFE